MRLEILLLLRRPQRVAEPSQAVGSEQLLLCYREIGIDNEVCLDDFRDFMLSDAARRVVRRSVLGNRCPIVGLRLWSTDVQIPKG